MPKILKKEKVLKISKRHFTVVIKNKENGLYISSTPSLAAKKAVSKLCASDKQKKVEFYIREITRDSKKKTYGPYVGYLEKLKIPIKLKEYIIKYNPIVKLIKKSMVKKIVMRGGTKQIWTTNSKNKYTNILPEIIIQTDDEEGLKKYKKFPYLNEFLINFDSMITKEPKYIYDIKQSMYPHRYNRRMSFVFRDDINDEILKTFIETQSQKMIKIFQKLELNQNVIVYLRVPYTNDNGESEPIYERIEYLEYKPDKMLKYLNIALKSFGIDKCLHLFSRFLESFPITLPMPIISVGSGNAYFEFLISTMHKREITCVDPNPRSFRINVRENSHQIVFIEPKFRTVDELILLNNRNQYNNCLLILNWPDPQNHNEQMYDLDAIIKLKPNGFFIIYDSNGVSGSNKMIQLLDSRSNTISFNEKLSYELLNKEEYFQRINQYHTTINYNFVVASYRRIEP